MRANAQTCEPESITAAALLQTWHEAKLPRPHESARHGIFHWSFWAPVHWGDISLPSSWQVENLLSSAQGFDWICLAMAFLFAAAFQSLQPWKAETKCRSHLIQMGTWILMACVMNLAVWQRFGEDSGIDWLAGYLLELFFMLENVFIFRYVIHSMELPQRLLFPVLEGLAWGQIAFEAVFFLGLAHKLRSVRFLPQFIGLALLILGVRSLLEPHKAAKAAQGSDDGSASSDARLANAGTVFAVLLAVDFLCEIDTVLTKIEEIPNPFVAFSSSAMAAFALPELFLLSQDLVKRFPMVRCGMGLILCFLGAQLMLGQLLRIQPLVTCVVMLGTILVFMLISMIVDPED